MSDDVSLNDYVAALREWAHKGLDRGVLTGSEREAAQMFVELDGVLSRNGFLPDDWKPRIEIVSYRDPDNETDLHIYVNGQERDDVEWCEADPGAGHTLSEWRQTGAEYAADASPAAAERIREFWSEGEASEHVTRE